MVHENDQKAQVVVESSEIQSTTSNNSNSVVVNNKKYVFLKGKKFEIIKCETKLPNLQSENNLYLRLEDERKQEGIVEAQMDPIVAPMKFFPMGPNRALKLIRHSKTISTNTDQLEFIDKQVQTEALELNNFLDYFCLTSQNCDENVIVGQNVHMGTKINKPSPAKFRFISDFHQCLTWNSGNLPIHKAVVDSNLNCVKQQCIVLKARKSNVNIVNSNNFTPLHLSVLHGANIEIVRILLKYDADMSILDPFGNNVLHLAVDNDREDLLGIFLENGNGNGTKHVDQFNHEGLTALMLCAFKPNRIRMAEMLLTSGATANLRDLKSGRTVIFHAAESHNTHLVSLLLDLEVDTKIRNFFGISAHDAMFELEDIPKEIKYPILHHKRQSGSEKGKQMNNGKRQKLEIVQTYRKITK